jgi:hypothetical protein
MNTKIGPLAHRPGIGGIAVDGTYRGFNETSTQSNL